MLLKLGFEALEQGEGIGCGAGEAGNDAAVAEPPHFACIGFNHRLAERHLAVAGQAGPILMAHGEINRKACVGSRLWRILPVLATRAPSCPDITGQKTLK